MGSLHPVIDHMSGMLFAYNAARFVKKRCRETMSCSVSRRLSIELNGARKSFPSIRRDFGRRLCWAEFIFRYGYFLFDLSRSLISIHHAGRTQTSISLMQLRAMEHCEICGLSGAGATHI
jgi:hypothetical protein